MEEQVNELRQYFVSELSLLKGVFSSTELTGRAKEVCIVIASACTTGTALFELGNKPQYFYAEMMMLGRSFIEKITNYCYLQICNDEEYKKFLLHPYYRAFHNSGKSKHAGDAKIGIRFTGLEELKKNPIVKEALNTFSETNHRKDWSNLGIDQKIALINEKTELSIEFFLLNTLSVYSNASEALHGSLYGCGFSTGAFNFDIDSKNSTQVELDVLKNTALIYTQFGTMIHETIKLLSSNTNIAPFLSASTANQKIALGYLKGIFQKP